MSEDSNFSLLSKETAVSCSFINNDGILMNLVLPSKYSVRKLKKTIFKELMGEAMIVNPLISDDKIQVESETSTISIFSSSSMVISITGGEEQVQHLKNLIEECPSRLIQARVFCMGKEIKPSVQLQSILY